MVPEVREITRPLTLTAEQERLLDLHSVANVLTLLHGRLYLASRGRVDVPEWMAEADTLPFMVEQMADSRMSLADLLDRLALLEQNVLSDIGRRASAEPGERGYWAELRESIALLFVVAGTRLRELAFGDRHAFVRVPSAFILSHLREFLVAAELHASGSWRLAFSPPAPADGWLVELHAEGPRGSLVFPPVMHDVLRDLVANARKYSAPGSRIRATIREAHDCLTIAVADEGRGIPEDEIDRVVEFGFRATNAVDRPTAGMGAGLTKAYVETRRLGGQLRIGSEPDRGTIVELIIPIPSPLRITVPEPRDR